MNWYILLKPLLGVLPSAFKTATADFKRKSDDFKYSLEESLLQINKLKNNGSLMQVAEFLRYKYHHYNQKNLILAFEECISQADKADFNNAFNRLDQSISRLHSGQHIDQSDNQIILNDIEPAMIDLLKFASLPRKLLNSTGKQLHR